VNNVYTVISCDPCNKLKGMLDLVKFNKFVNLSDETFLSPIRLKIEIKIGLEFN